MPLNLWFHLFLCMLLTLCVPVETFISFQEISTFTAKYYSTQLARTANTSLFLLHNSSTASKPIKLIQVWRSFLQLCNIIIYSWPQTCTCDLLNINTSFCVLNNFLHFTSSKYFYNLDVEYILLILIYMYISIQGLTHSNFNSKLNIS